MIRLLRNSFTPNGIFGKLILDENYFLYTIEHSYNNIPKIPEGRYVCQRGEHIIGGNPLVTYEVLNVPGHTGILIHPGNTQEETSGCILIGTKFHDDYLFFSKMAFRRLMAYLNNAETFDLEVLNE